ncbi:MAG: amino acid adenylation domain-containing protein [Vicinamibacterales bacterium]
MTIHQQFERQVQETPDATAVTCEGESLSYRELNLRANQVGHHLMRLGVGPESLVGLYLERSLDTIVALLGVLKAGGAYLPVDSAYPSERVAFMLEDAQVEVFLTQERLLNRVPVNRARVVRIDTDWNEIAQEPGTNPVSGVTAANLAYVMYTSGSTGQPKGVPVQHDSVLHMFAVLLPEFGCRPSDVWTVCHSYGFDVSVWEMFGALFCGGRLVIVPQRVVQSPTELYGLIRTQQVTVILLTPSALHQLLQAGHDIGALPLRLVFVGADAFPSSVAIEALKWDVPVWNLYGPTESTIWATLKQAVAADAEYNTVPIGKPMADLTALVLDDDLRPVPAGTAAELYLGGAGLARGYFKRPALTAEKFLPDPFSATPGARLYRTGDLARTLDNGDIEHLGRLDHQVKLRGFRIELGEIEAVLGAHRAVDQCVVAAREDEPGEKRLVAYLTPVAGRDVPVRELLALAKAKLPEYMVPAAFVVLPELPLTPNKKVDRRALPAPSRVRPEYAGAWVAPGTPTEEALSEIWTGVVCLDRVGANDNFFQLGGHSLLATRMISRVRDRFQVDLSLCDVFESPTLTGLAAIVDRAQPADGSASAAIGRAARDGHLPPTFPQERVWFLQQLFPTTVAYQFQSTLRIRGRLDVPALERSLTEIISRHEICRTTFPAIDGRPVQVVHEPWPVRLDVIDLEPIPDADRSDAADRAIRAEIQHRFDLTRLPLIRWALFRVSEDEHVLLHIEHHLLHDGWSFNVFLDELVALYRAFSAGKPSPLPELAIQFADFAVWQRQWMQGEVAAAQLNYWRSALGDAPRVLDLPADRPRPAVQGLHGSSLRIELPLPLCESLRRLSRQQGATLFMTLLAAFEILMRRLTSQDDFLVGSGIANRRWPETESLIGMLVNTIALRADLSGDPTFPELLGRVRRATVDAYTHQDLPFDTLVDALQRTRDLSRNALFQVMFNFHDAPLPELSLPGATIDLVEVVSNGTAKFDLNVIVIPRSEQRVTSATSAGRSGMTMIWEYNTDLFDEATIRRFERHYQTVLEQLVADPNRRIADIPVLTEAERRRLVTEWRGKRSEFPRDSAIHDLLAQQVARTPDATAVVFADQRVTYAELNRRANQLAHFLRSRGVGVDARVGVCLERSVEMVVGLLGILKAGGAYVPLDPAHPAERSSLVLADAGVELLLTQEKFRTHLPVSAARVICLDTQWPDVATFSEDDPPPTAGAENLAYVMYTSGSTGTPKGVSVTHRSVVRLVRETDYAAFGPDEIFLQLAPMTFDASTFEVWGALLNGARLEIMPPGTVSLSELASSLRQRAITTLWLTAGLFQQMVDSELDSLRGLRQLLAGGDVLSPAHVETVLRELPACRLINGYGPTENATFTCTYQCEPNERFAGSVPIGVPIANTEVYVLDRGLEPVPIGVAGSLYVGGDGLARGYLNDAALTAEKFIPHHLSSEPGRRLYRTGDRARFLASGAIEFLGRADGQVKIRGYRVELGEIESVLARHPRVRECAVSVRGGSAADKRLVAYLVSRDASSLEPGELSAFLQTHLPGHMVPTQFVSVEQLPLTANGKVDRLALPDVALDRSAAAGAFVAPRTPAEELLAGIWATLLKLPEIGVNDNFFHLGGHSLIATRVMARVRDAFQVDLPLRRLFDAPTVAQLSAVIEQTRSRGPQPAVRAISPASSRSQQLRTPVSEV